jgi:hypothetical protein
MLVVLTLIYVFKRVLAIPIPVVILDDRAAPSSCTDLGNCRTILNIVWSCLVTIFACTWASIHPNVPKPGTTNRHWYSRPLRRAHIMFLALIGPEFFIFWAWRQRRVASIRSETLQGMFS